MGSGEISQSGGSEEVENGNSDDPDAVWQDLMRLKDEQPSIYLKITQGNSPKNIVDAKEVIEAINEEVEKQRLSQSGGIPGA
jgi:hypothetical protein